MGRGKKGGEGSEGKEGKKEGKKGKQEGDTRHTNPSLLPALLAVIALQTRNTFCGTWYLPHSHVHNERTVPIIMAVCMAHEREGRISTSGLKSDVTIVFLDPDFLNDA